MLTRVRLRAPQEDRTALIDPPWESLGDLLAENRARRRQYRFEMLGRRFADVSQQARAEVVAAAHAFTRHADHGSGLAALDPSHPAESGWKPDLHDRPIVMAGHQPELFHPGVWFKNFALDALARQHSALAINLIVDSDTLRTPALRVPGSSIEAPTARAIPFDASAPETPFEERPIIDPALFASFGERVAAEIAPLVSNPLIKRLWPLVLEAAGSRPREPSGAWGAASAARLAAPTLGFCLARGRHLLEEAWGLGTLEIPQSQVCGLSSFHWFAAHLLAESPRLFEVYNGAVDEYRRVNGIRSANHPVPKLAGDGDWYESPFWIWSAARPQRRRAFVHRTGSELVLSDRDAVEARLPLEGDPARLVVALAEFCAQKGIRLRTRALITTCWARLFLCDLFLHGIGGAKYDQLTDEIVRRFFGCEPPRYAVISATLHLPIPRQRVTANDLRVIDQRLRGLDFHPARYLDRENLPSSRAAEIEDHLASKACWIGTPATRENAKARCRAIRAANLALQDVVEPLRMKLRQKREEVALQLSAEAILASREYSFCLYPEQTLRDFMLEIHSTKP